MRETNQTTQKPERHEFNLVVVNYNFEIKPKLWPVLEINAKAFWYSDRIKTPNLDTLTTEINKAIGKAFGAKGLNCARGAHPDTKKKGGAK